MAKRLFAFDYQNDYDPLLADDRIRKSVYNYNDYDSSTLSSIAFDIDENQVKLFEKVSYTTKAGKEKTQYEDHDWIKQRKYDYAGAQKNSDGEITDGYTGRPANT